MNAQSNDGTAKAQGSPSTPSIPAAVPAATPVERGRFVLELHNRDEESDDDSANQNKHPSSNEFDPDEILNSSGMNHFPEEERIRDEDLDRLLGPLPSLRNNSNANSNSRSLSITGSDVTDEGCSDDDTDSRRNHKRFRRKKPFCPCCPDSVRRGPCAALSAFMDAGPSGSVPTPTVGNMIVVFPNCLSRRGFGIIGPHWFGPVSCVVILTAATAYYVPQAYRHVGPVSSFICILFYTISISSLCVVSCSDPGVVKLNRGGGMDGVGVGRNGYAGVPTSDEEGGLGVSSGPDGAARSSGRDWKNWRYCDFCGVYQPPGAMHCPECNVCIEGYDHHCPWMGTCIGKKNFESFVMFNLSWLLYLFYAVIWVLVVGPSLHEAEHKL